MSVHCCNNLDFLLQRTDLEGCVDLVYLDPPYNSSRDYGVVTEGTYSVAYTDRNWHWDSQIIQDLQFLLNDPIISFVDILENYLRLRDEAMAAYIGHLLPRLHLLHRNLKPTGMLVLQCDQAAVHWLRVALDAVFGASNFCSQVQWKRAPAHNKDTRTCPPDTDYLLMYSKTSSYVWNPIWIPHTKQYLDSCERDQNGLWKAQPLTGPGKRNGESGMEWNGTPPYAEGRPRHWAINKELKRQYESIVGQPLKGSVLQRLDLLKEAGLLLMDGPQPLYKGYIDPNKGTQLQQTWSDIANITATSKESVSFETQKPVQLLERIIRLCSNEDGLVLDPYSGSGTTGVAAIQLLRRFIGTEVSPDTAKLANKRLEKAQDSPEYYRRQQAATTRLIEELPSI